jgi:hypothetical protein
MAGLLSGTSAWYGYTEKKRHQEKLEVQIQNLRDSIQGNVNVDHNTMLEILPTSRYVSY